MLQQPLHRIAPILVVVAVAALAVAAAATTDAAPTPFSACSLVSLQDAKGMWDSAAKTSDFWDNPLPNGQQRAVCNYIVSTTQYVEKKLEVEVTRPVTKAQFEAGKQQDEAAFNPTIGKVQNVAGLGDQAYSFGFYNFGAVRFLKGQYAVKLTVEYKRDNVSVDPARIVAGLVPIARKAVGRVP